MPNDPTTDVPVTPSTEQRRRYEPPRLERKRSVARVTLASSGGGQTTSTVAFARRHHP